jgi:3-deoxy-manno-octulosonate cytidylyltransferase (CMP-KDO synthetase)
MPLIVIPARMASTRLPGKPLADIGGRPMIAWMVEIGRAADIGPVLVAAAEPEIAEAASAAGAEAILTDPALPSGTDRAHAAADAYDPREEHQIVVNLQGDMPTMNPADIARAVALLEANPCADIATLASPSDDPEDRANPNVVKAIAALNGAAGRALYFTRAPAPTGAGPVWRHVGLYVYRRSALARFVAAAPTALEKRESLEQLRALELGMRIEVGIVEDFPKGVDSPADLEAARRILLTASQGRPRAQ